MIVVPKSVKELPVKDIVQYGLKNFPDLKGLDEARCAEGGFGLPVTESFTWRQPGQSQRKMRMGREGGRITLDNFHGWTGDEIDSLANVISIVIGEVVEQR